MTLPAFIFGFLLSTLYGVLFHLWRGGNLWRLILYIILSWFGFWFGNALGGQLNITIFDIGPLHVGIATFSSIVFLSLGYWLSLVEVRKK
jgi:hypothetical protein